MEKRMMEVYFEKTNPSLLMEGDLVLSETEFFKVISVEKRESCRTCSGRPCTKVRFHPFMIIHYHPDNGVVDMVVSSPD
jgi:hypothetical protein